MINTANYFAKRENLYLSDLHDIKNICAWVQNQFDVEYYYNGKQVKIQSGEITALGQQSDGVASDYVRVSMPTDRNVIMSIQEARELRDCLSALLEEIK